MKKTILISLIAILTGNINVCAQKSGATEDSIYQAVEVMPEYPGGLAACMRWFAEQLPETKSKGDTVPVVVTRFVVETDGSISRPEIVQGFSRNFDRKVLRLVRKMPHWEPGKHHGKAVRTRYTVTLRFFRDE